jgi:hypothetical protein
MNVVGKAVDKINRTIESLNIFFKQQCEQFIRIVQKFI